MGRGIGAGLYFVGMIAICFSVNEAMAIEKKIEPKPPGPVFAPPDMTFDIAFGAALTTDYVSRGITNSDSDFAVQGYIEPSIGWAYLNVWSSNVDYGPGFRGAEIDVTAGARPKFGPLSLDLGYVHYFYTPDDTSPDYGELFVKAEYEIDERFTVGTHVFFAPDYNDSGDTGTFVAGGVRVHLPYDFSAIAGVGYQFFENPNAFEQLTWTVGLSYHWNAMTFEVRYWDTDLKDSECVVRSGFSDGCDARVVGTVSFDTSWSQVKDWLK